MIGYDVISTFINLRDADCENTTRSFTPNTFLFKNFLKNPTILNLDNRTLAELA